MHTGAVTKIQSSKSLLERKTARQVSERAATEARATARTQPTKVLKILR